MKKTLALLVICLMTQSIGTACICTGDDFDERLNKKRAIFIGKLTEIFQENDFEPLNGSGWFYKIYKFKVLGKCVAGGDFTSNWIYVFDDASSSCAGFLSNCIVGDTVLTFAIMPANPYEPGFIHGTQCCAYKILSSDRKGRDKEYDNLFFLSQNEKELIANRSMWKVIQHAPDVFPATEVKKPEQYSIPWLHILGLSSVLLNILLLWRIFWKKK